MTPRRHRDSGWTIRPGLLALTGASSPASTLPCSSRQIAAAPSWIRVIATTLRLWVRRPGSWQGVPDLEAHRDGAPRCHRGPCSRGSGGRRGRDPRGGDRLARVACAPAASGDGPEADTGAAAGPREGGGEWHGGRELDSGSAQSAGGYRLRPGHVHGHPDGLELRRRSLAGRPQPGVKLPAATRWWSPLRRMARSTAPSSPPRPR